MLSSPTAEICEKAALFKGRFTGDPSNEFEQNEVKQIPGEGGEINEEHETVNIYF